VSTVEEALKMSPEAFKERYNRDKPSEEDIVIFYCKMGGRALKATNSAIGLGYKK
jgi:rhodanese-related sulfurtransferase